jgi:predicted acetyltransferase
MEQLSMEYEGPRGAVPREFGEILDFLNFVFRSDRGRRPSMGGDYPHLYREANAEYIRHIRHKGKIVSCVSIYPCTVQWGEAQLKVGGIGGVGTDPEYRKAGLAGQNLRDALDFMRRNGFDISILWTGLGDYYRTFGWETAGEMWSFDMTRTTITYLPSAPTGEILTSVADSRVIDGVMQLRKTEPRGVVWDRELTETMLGSPIRYRVALLVVDDEPRAYIAYSPEEHISVDAHAGDPASVLGLIRVVFGEQGARTAKITTPAENAGVVPLLRNAGFPARSQSQGMIAVIDPARVVGAYGIGDITFERTTHEQHERDGWAVTIGDRTHHLSPLNLTKLLFGPERPPGIEHPKLPLPFHYPNIDHM